MQKLVKAMKNAQSKYRISTLQDQYSQHKQLLHNMMIWKKYNSVRNPLTISLAGAYVEKVIA